MQTLTRLFNFFETSNFNSPNIVEEVHNNYKFIKGNLILAGREPDGDSVAFIADNIEHFQGVYRSYLLKPSSRDNSVQLRFEGIDAPELHYGSAFQPLAVAARDYLLTNLLGFHAIAYNTPGNSSHPSTAVSSSEPIKVPVMIATSALETHGRPIAYIFNHDEEFEDGATAPLDALQLEDSINYKMLESGFAYLLAYTSMPTAHYKVFKQVANDARANRRGVWNNDTTADFILADLSSIAGSKAQMIYPKLFRRCIDFLKTGEPDLKEWLRKADAENDGVRITESTTVSISSLIRHVNDHIYFQADTNDIVFIEK